MRILHVIPYFSWAYGGPVRNVYELAKKLYENGHEVTIFTTDVSRNHRILESERITFEENIDIRYFKCINNWIASKMKFHLSPEMRLAIKNEITNYDIVHLHDYRAITHNYVQNYAKKYAVPYILQAHGAAPKIYGNQNLKFTFSKILFDFFFGKKILQNSSRIIALTKTEVNQYLELGAESSKIEIVPNGIRLYEYENLPEKGEFRKKYAIQADEKIILYLGRIHKIKGIDLLLRTFFNIIKTIPNVKLVIVGPDDGFLSEMEQQIKLLKIEDHIIYTGPLYANDKLGAYVDANIYVLPSIYETFPMTVLEAFACGKPVIVTDRCGIANIVEDAGFVVKYEEKELSNAIIKLLNNEELANKIGRKSKELVAARFDLEYIIEKTINIYNDVMLEQSNV